METENKVNGNGTIEVGGYIYPASAIDGSGYVPPDFLRSSRSPGGSGTSNATTFSTNSLSSSCQNGNSCNSVHQSLCWNSSSSSKTSSSNSSSKTSSSSNSVNSSNSCNSVHPSLCWNSSSGSKTSSCNQKSISSSLTKTASNSIAGYSNNNLIFNLDSLKNNSKVLRETVQSIENSWTDIINKQVGELEKSWAGPDASVYTEKVKAFDSKIKAACQAIELLAGTFDKSGNEMSETQSQNVSDIDLI